MSMRVVRTAACLTAVLALSSGSALTAARPAASDKTIIVGVTDANGKPVTGLTAEHFRMREDGVDREITSVKPSDQPLSIVLLVDTTKAAIDLTQDMRTAVKSFVHYVHQAQPSADIQLMEFGQAAIPNTPFTKDDDVLDKAMDKMVGKPDAGSRQLFSTPVVLSVREQPINSRSTAIVDHLFSGASAQSCPRCQSQGDDG